MINDLFLSLGTNIEPRIEYLKKTIKLLNEIFQFNSISSLYRTGPLEDIDQDDFYNLCIFYTTNIDDPFKILNIIKDIENIVGRKKDIIRPKGPRVIDIDILIFDDKNINFKELSIPHKKMLERRFVLQPLMEILPDDSVYIKKFDFLNFLKKVKFQKVTNIGELIFE